jgi:hypothetical protein
MACSGLALSRFVRPESGDLRDTLAKILAGKLASATAQADPVEQVRTLTIELIEMRAELTRLKVAQEERVQTRASADDAELTAARKEIAGLMLEVENLRQELAQTPRPRLEIGRSAGRDSEFRRDIAAGSGFSARQPHRARC